MISIDRALEGGALLQVGDWTLFRREDVNGSKWRRLKLVRSNARRSPGHRRSFHLSHDGERFAEGADLAALREQEPELFGQVADLMHEAFAKPEGVDAP